MPVRKPFVPRTPHELRQWRRECCNVSQVRLGRELGVTNQTLCAYERGKMPIPPLLPWALAGIFKPLRSRLRYEARRRRENTKRRRLRRPMVKWRRAEREKRQLVSESVDLLGRILKRGNGPTPEEEATLEALRTSLAALDSVPLPRQKR